MGDASKVCGRLVFAPPRASAVPKRATQTRVRTAPFGRGPAPGFRRAATPPGRGGSLTAGGLAVPPATFHSSPAAGEGPPPPPAPPPRPVVRSPACNLIPARPALPAPGMSAPFARIVLLRSATSGPNRAPRPTPRRDRASRPKPPCRSPHRRATALRRPVFGGDRSAASVFPERDFHALRPVDRSDSRPLRPDTFKHRQLEPAPGRGVVPTGSRTPAPGTPAAGRPSDADRAARDGS